MASDPGRAHVGVLNVTLSPWREAELPLTIRGGELLMRRVLIAVLMAGLVSACSGDRAVDTTVPSSSPIPTTTTAELPDPTTTTMTLETTTSTTVGAAAPSLVALVPGPVSPGPVSGASTAQGFPIVAYVSSDGELQLVRCHDRLCEAPVSEVTLGIPGEPAEIDLALLPDGSPAVVVQAWSASVAFVYVCSDPTCESVEVSELGDPEACVHSDGNPCQFTVDYPSIVVSSDGLPGVVYLTNINPRSVKVATCETRTCGSWGWGTIDQLPPDTSSGAPSVRIDSQGQLFVGYWYSQPTTGASTSRIAVCREPACFEPASVVTIEGSVFAQTTHDPDSEGFLAWHQTGAEGLPAETANPEDNFAALWSEYSDFIVSTCSAEGCADEEYVEVGEDWLLAQAAGAFHLFTATEDTTAVFFNHASRAEPTPQLHVTVCTDNRCNGGHTYPLGVDTIDGPFFDVINGPNALPQVVFISVEGTVDIYSCTNPTCTP